MNSIQKAFKLQDIHIAWSGSEPNNSMVITDDYLNSSTNGFPRMVRTSEDTGKDYDLNQLKTDFDTIRENDEESVRIKNIKEKAGEIIYAAYSDEKQRNLTARGLELLRIENSRTLTTTEETELDDIQAIWDWIKSIREASNVAEEDGTLAYMVDWPENI